MERLVRTLILILIGGFFLVFRSETPVSAQDEHEPIVIWTYWQQDSAEYRHLELVLDTFSEETGYNYELQFLSLIDMQATLTTVLEAGSSDLPDVAIMPSTDLAIFCQTNGLLANLNDVVDETNGAGVNRDAYSQQLLQLAEYETDSGNGWYGLPLNVTLGGLVWYNTSNFENAGVSEPTTYDEFVAILDAIQASGATPLSLALGDYGFQASTILASLMLGQPIGNIVTWRNEIVPAQVEAYDDEADAFESLASLEIEDPLLRVAYVEELAYGYTPWDYAGVVAAWETYFEFLNNYSLGAEVALQNTQRDTVNDIGEGEAVLTVADSSVETYLLEAGYSPSDFGFFPLPSQTGNSLPQQVFPVLTYAFIDPEIGHAAPQTVALMVYLSSDEGAQEWVEVDEQLRDAGVISALALNPHTAALSEYRKVVSENPLRAELATQIQTSDLFTFGYYPQLLPEIRQEQYNTLISISGGTSIQAGLSSQQAFSYQTVKIRCRCVPYRYYSWYFRKCRGYCNAF